MNMEQETLERHLKKAQFWNNTFSVITALIVACGVGYGFYYNTKNTLINHSEQIQNLQNEVNEVKEKVNESAVFQGVSGAQVKALEEKVNSMNEKIDKMDDKLDQILLKK